MLLLSLPRDVLLEILQIKELNATLSSQKWFRVCKTLYDLKGAAEDACMGKALENDMAALRICRLLLDMRYIKVRLLKEEIESLCDDRICKQNSELIIPFKTCNVTNKVNSFIDELAYKLKNGVLFVYHNHISATKEHIRGLLFFLITFHELDKVLRLSKPDHVLYEYRRNLRTAIEESSKLINAQGEKRVLSLEPTNNRFTYKGKKFPNPVYISSSNKQIPRFIISMANMFRSVMGDTDRDYLDHVVVNADDGRCCDDKDCYCDCDYYAGPGQGYIHSIHFHLVCRKAWYPRFNHFYTQ